MAMSPHRPMIEGTRCMVVAGHHLAAHAAFTILEAGGNAVDAGVAAGLSLGVLQSDIVNVAGVAPMMIYWKGSEAIYNIDGVGTWPRAASCSLFEREHGGAIPDGLLRTVVPAAPNAWITALEHFGTMGFGDVAAAAIRFAREGFPMHSLMAEGIKDNSELYGRWPSNAAIYLPNGRPPVPGKLFVQTDLARTLQYMVDEESAHSKGNRKQGLRAARKAFYSGDIAATIITFHRENGGLLRAEDMDEYQVNFEPTVKLTISDIDIHVCGPWSQGPVLAQTLRLLEGTDLQSLGHNTVRYIHTLTEALKLSFADRHHYYGDPRFVKVPLDDLLSVDYAERRRKMIRADRAWPEMPPAGDLMDRRAVPEHERQNTLLDDKTPPSYDTSYVCVIDKDGNAFSATPSDVSRDTPVIPGTGVCPSSRGSQSWADPDHPACVAPGKRPRLTPNPALALRHGRPYMLFGTPGGDIQPQAMLQVLLNILVFGMHPQNAVEAPRFGTHSFPNSFEPHRYYPGRLTIENRISSETGSALEGLGHKVDWWPEWSWRAGAVCVILCDQESGILRGGSDPRRPTYALGW